MNFVYITDIRARLIKLIDHVINQYNSKQLFTLNEGRLEEWCDFLHSMITSKVDIVQKFRPRPNIKKKLLKLPPPQLQSSLENLVYSEAQRKLAIVRKNGEKVQVQSQYIRKYCSILPLDNQNHLISGGCKKNNKKSDQILLFNTKTLKVNNIGYLPQGVSSHASIFMDGNVYFVGGNKQEGVITRSCSKMNLSSKNIQEVSPLNYPTASMCLVNWKNEYIYKIGGIGECFGQKNISPYIERYHEQFDEWEIINPTLKGQLQNSFTMYAHSLGFTTRNQIIIFGGFDIQKKSTNLGFKIKVNPEVENSHQITDYGLVNMQQGGFLSNHFMTSQSHLYTIQMKVSPKIHNSLIQIPYK